MHSCPKLSKTKSSPCPNSNVAAHLYHVQVVAIKASAHKEKKSNGRAGGRLSSYQPKFEKSKDNKVRQSSFKIHACTTPPGRRLQKAKFSAVLRSMRRVYGKILQRQALMQPKQRSQINLTRCRSAF